MFTDGFSISGFLGKGSFGEISTLCNKQGITEFALKRLTTLGVTVNGVDYYEKEFKFQQQCISENIVKCYEYYSDNSFVYARLELCETDLRKLINEHKEKQTFISIKESTSFLQNIANGLTEIHNQKLIHRDIKPSNIMLKNGIAKIGDFGLVTINEFVSQECGTNGYKAPEMYRYDYYSYEVDIWAFGCVSYELLTNERAFPISNNIMRKVQYKKIPDKQFENSYESQIYNTIRSLSQKCLENDPKLRPNAKECNKELRIQ